MPLTRAGMYCHWPIEAVTVSGAKIAVLGTNPPTLPPPPSIGTSLLPWGYKEMSSILADQ